MDDSMSDVGPSLDLFWRWRRGATIENEQNPDATKQKAKCDEIPLERFGPYPVKEEANSREDESGVVNVETDVVVHV